MLPLTKKLISAVGKERMRNFMLNQSNEFGYNKKTNMLYASIGMWRMLRQIQLATQ